MPHIFDGPPDARQGDEALATSRFRPRYRALTAQELALHDKIKQQAVELEALFSQVPDGRYRAMAMTSLELAVMWAVKELTA